MPMHQFEIDKKISVLNYDLALASKNKKVGIPQMCLLCQ